MILGLTRDTGKKRRGDARTRRAQTDAETPGHGDPEKKKQKRNRKIREAGEKIGPRALD